MESHALITGWPKLAAREGFPVVCPQGTQIPQRWNSGPGWADAVDDVQFFRDMLTDLSAVAAVDPTRVYVIGSAAGAVGTMEGCAPSRPVSAMVFHGTDDPVVLYEGGEVEYLPLRLLGDALGGSPYLVGVNWVPEWAEANGCNPTPKAIPAPGDVQGVRYTGCQDGADVVFYSVVGAGHT